jgi:hypothetical protein
MNAEDSSIAVALERQGASHREQTKMEISPIPGIRNQPTIRPKETFLGLPEVFEVEYSSRTGDETYSPAGTGPGSGYEEDEFTEEEDELEDREDEPEAEPETRPKTAATGNGPVNYFA